MRPGRRLENDNYLRWLMVTRVAVTATLLISAFGIELIFAPSESLLPLYALCAATFILVLAYAALYRLLWRRPLFASIQIIGDLLVVTGFVYATGGVASPMTFLYFVPIITASVLLLRRGAFLAAAAASVLYASLAATNVLKLLPAFPRSVEFDTIVDGRHIVYSLLSHLVGFFLAAIFASLLSEKVRRTDRELAEKRSDLAELRALNENIVESINSGLVTTDLEGRITFVNPGACEITGNKRGDLVGTKAHDLFGLDTTFLRKIGGVLEKGRRFRLEKHFQSAAGSEKFLGIAVSILRDREDRSLGYIFIFQDLTEINALERQVRLKERMAALGEMAAGMAHELRNPLASISGSVQVLKTELKPSGDQLELMDIILRESERLDQAIRDFLLFAKPGRFSPELADVVRVIQDSARLLRNSHDIRPNQEIEVSSCWPEIWCELDVNRMKQVFWNLATNALKAMPQGGLLRIDVSAGPAGLDMAFEDRGVGMSEEEMEKYFQPFRGTFREGTGLGAAIVYRIVEEHGGTIGIESRPGKGTTVRVRLPASTSRTAPVAPSVSPGAAAGAGS